MSSSLVNVGQFQKFDIGFLVSETGFHIVPEIQTEMEESGVNEYSAPASALVEHYTTNKLQWLVGQHVVDKCTLDGHYETLGKFSSQLWQDHTALNCSKVT